MAWWRMSLLLKPQSASSAPDLATLMFTASKRRPAAVALGEDPVEATDVPGEVPVPVAVEDLDAPHAGARRDADDAVIVVERPDRARHVRAVAVVVGPGRPVRAGAVVAARDVEVRVRPDAGVDDRDVRIDALVRSVDVGDRGAPGPDAPDAGRDRLRGELDDLVLDDGHDVGVGEERATLVGIEGRGEAADRARERATGTHVGTGRGTADGRRGLDPGLEHDDVLAGGIEAAVRGGGCVRDDRVGRGRGLLGRRRGGLDGRG